MNLLNNASKYTQPGGHVTLQARLAGKEQWVEIVVADNGPGIEMELLPRVFDLFSQGPTTLDRARGGLGLGLALVKRLVELHGGTVAANSAGRGKGATFTVCLPRLTQSEPAQDKPARSQTNVTKSLRVLIVDDNPDALEMLSMLLEVHGHHVLRARDGEEAIDFAQRFAPEVILLDLGLPKLDGWEVARRLRADPMTADIMLIALSGYGQEDDRERSRAAGFDNHFLKPADLNAIYRAVADNKRWRNAG